MIPEIILLMIVVEIGKFCIETYNENLNLLKQLIL